MRVYDYKENCNLTEFYYAGGGRCHGGQSTCTSCSSCMACTNRCKKSEDFNVDSIIDGLTKIYNNENIF